MLMRVENCVRVEVVNVKHNNCSCHMNGSTQEEAIRGFIDTIEDDDEARCQECRKFLQRQLEAVG